MEIYSIDALKAIWHESTVRTRVEIRNERKGEENEKDGTTTMEIKAVDWNRVARASGIAVVLSV